MTAPVLDDSDRIATVPPEVASFAAAVRTALDDLEAEERDDLVDGLEAELLDRVADSGPDALGDPAAYAEELRAAAGLPPRSSRRRSTGGSLRRAVAFVREEGRAWLLRHPRWAGLSGFLSALRPVWWVLRAIVAYQVGVFLLSGMGGGSGWWLLPIDGGKLLVLAGLTVISVQLGRGRWMPRPWMRGVAGAAQAVLIVATPFVIGNAVSTVNSNYWAQGYLNESEMYDPFTGFGRTAEGTPVFNVYAYDAEGKPIEQVRLYDQDGNPLNLVGYGESYVIDPLTGTRVIVPSDATPGSEGWNVYPLASVGQRALEELGGVAPAAPRIEPGFPFAAVPPLLGAETDGMVPDASEGTVPDASEQMTEDVLPGAQGAR